jgi:hypothetical protein
MSGDDPGFAALGFDLPNALTRWLGVQLNN